MVTLPYNLSASVLFLVVVNLLPLGGVLYFDWDVAALMVLYWSENLIIGAYNLLKMVTVGGVLATFPGIFFIVHYGGFCAVHGLFLLSLLMDDVSVMNNMSWPFFLVFVELLLNVIEAVLAQAPPEWIIAFIGLTISHGYSFATNFLFGRERYHTTVSELMAAPYKRIVILHIAVIAGGFGISALGEPLVLLLALIALKIVVDIHLHRVEHRQRDEEAA